MTEHVNQTADRYNIGKPNWHLVSMRDLEPMVRVLEYGANKYTPDNWKKGAPRKELLDCAMRHLISLYEEDDIDSESGQNHAGHIMCNMMMFMYNDRMNNFKDKPLPVCDELTVEQNETTMKENLPNGTETCDFHKALLLGMEDLNN